MKENDAQRAIKVLQNDVEKLRKEKTAAETEITKLNAELSSISGRYKEDVRRAREALTKMESQNNSFRENNRRLEEAWKNADARSKYSASRFNQLSQQLANVSRQLMEEKSNSGQKLAQLHFQNKTLHDKNRTLNDMNKNLHDKNDTLRQMVVPVSEKQVLDADVQQKFTALRSSIVGLVRQTWIPALKHDFDSLGMSVLQGDLITTEFPMTYERLRCMVFFFINAGIFDTRSYFLGHPFENLEQLVRRVEKELNQYSPRGRFGICSRITLPSYAHLLTQTQRTKSSSRSGAMPLSRPQRSSETTDVACLLLCRRKSGISSAHSRPKPQMRDKTAGRN